MQAMIDAVCDEIKQSLNAFCAQADLERLTPEAAERMSEALLASLSAGGVEGYRVFLRKYECEQNVIERGGETLRAKCLSPKEFLTAFGNMSLERKIFQADRGGECYVPLDAAWGMEGQFAAPEVREAVLIMCGLNPPAHVETMLEKFALFKPSSTAIKNMASAMGAWVEENKSALREEMKDGGAVPENTRVLGVSLDGANVPLREAGPKRGRPGERPGKQDKTGQPTAWKNAMVGSVTYYGDVPEGQESPARLASRYVARMPEERAPTFKKDLECVLDDVQSMLPEDVEKVIVVDGARGLWKYIEDNGRFADYEKILDYFHAVEHLSALSEALFGKKSEKGAAWYDKYREKLLHEDLAANAILRSADHYLANNKLSNNQREDARKERTFFQRNKHRMTYADFRRRGLPIGSGIVEAACKTIVKSRLCRSGMRWSGKGGQDILHLRAQIHSGCWDKFWKAHKTISRAA